MNAQALKRFVEEYQRLVEEYSYSLEQCKKLEGESALYHRDREALMDFSNEADERARESEQKLVEVKEEVRKLQEELQYYKSRCDAKVDATGYNLYKVDAASTARALFEANGVIASKVLADVKALQDANHILRSNLLLAEEEVEALFQENKTLRMESVREKRIAGSGGRRSNSASSSKGNRRKSSTNLSSNRSVEKKIDYGDEDLLMFPLSPLQLNSPESAVEAAQREEFDSMMLEAELSRLTAEEKKSH